MPGRLRLAAALMVAGLGTAWLAQLISPSPTTPLFDGVFVEDPYLFVEPPPSAGGNPLSVEVTNSVVDGAVPLLAAATAEVPPQAQIIAQADAFEISADSSSVTVSITPSAPRDPGLVGNVYTFSVTDQEGSPLAIRPGALVTIVLRAPEQNLVAQVARFDGDEWVTLPTQHGGLPDLFAANIEQLGDYGVLLSAAASPSAGASGSPAPSAGVSTPSPDSGMPTWVIVLLAVAAVGAGLAWGLFSDGDQR